MDRSDVNYGRVPLNIIINVNVFHYTTGSLRQRAARSEELRIYQDIFKIVNNHFELSSQASKGCARAFLRCRSDLTPQRRAPTLYLYK